MASQRAGELLPTVNNLALAFIPSASALDIAAFEVSTRPRRGSAGPNEL